ncbi:ABC transporter ATP-binding protein [Clostridium formicaceticum]|uniref:Sn-glycerol-3-phosphate import ATP-binding protein UgpC n=1 Tax=Clostridium formicaceticum TaxID=1497 RepID=A0AAC9RJH6_9CLOT|nr:sn-glycerol-3-phosphate ABC transporter ATP-binding protein UgpC [Clostridium formicaceticum]AOY77665.1 sugar ABC transporter ATP-binding protein [Clostridium formicaceticum]ARE88251.1 sn-glycerol-3-phosphate import ATP-binding protein UgpC [Clostridium formicaceticum]
MSAIKLENIYKRYSNDVIAVDNFNLQISEKEFIVLVGPSGCGKSTTLRMIAGLESISEGSLYIGDQKVNDQPPKERDIAMVFQNYALYPHMNVYDNMAFGLKLKKYNKEEIKRRVKQAAVILDIENYLHRKPKELSGGQRQRVALGRAIVREPKVFLMDEPLSNLDAKLRAQMRTEISKLHKKLETTFVYVTHDQVEAMTMADRIVIMKEGVVQQIGKPSEVYDYPANMFVGGFIGSPPMNFIEGRLEKNRLILGQQQLAIYAVHQEGLKNYNDKKIILGIRPEDIHLTVNTNQDKFYESVEALIEVKEFLGSQLHLHCSVNATPIIAAIEVKNSFSAGENEKIQLKFDMEKVHFFDINTQERISG